MKLNRLHVALALMLLWRLAWFMAAPICAEDAYITFHASQVFKQPDVGALGDQSTLYHSTVAAKTNWAAAVTSPVWAILCSLGDPPTTARILSLLADALALWAAWSILGQWAFWAFVLYWASPFFTGSAVSGLETHAVAALLLVGRAIPQAYGLAAVLRPDAALLALCASGRNWRWPLLGGLSALAIGWAFSGHLIPQTITSKALTYGVHFGSWGWLAPHGFGLLALGLIPALAGWRRLYVLAPLAFLLAHVAIGTPQFWWYAVPPFAMLGLAACEQIRGWRGLVVAATLVVCLFPTQRALLNERLEQEEKLWNLGGEFVQQHPSGTVMLEPAGIIPYRLGQSVSVVDEVGLLDPWMARRRRAGNGWRTDAIAHYRPDWIILRQRELLMYDRWSDGFDSKPYRNKAESTLPGYVVVYAPDLHAEPSADSSRVNYRYSFRSSAMMVLARKED